MHSSESSKEKSVGMNIAQIVSVQSKKHAHFKLTFRGVKLTFFETYQTPAYQCIDRLYDSAKEILRCVPQCQCSQYKQEQESKL